MQCSYFDAGLCRSCTFMGVPYAEQLAEKQRIVRELLAGHPDSVWSPAVASADDPGHALGAPIAEQVAGSFPVDLDDNIEVVELIGEEEHMPR